MFENYASKNENHNSLMVPHLRFSPNMIIYFAFFVNVNSFC